MQIEVAERPEPRLRRVKVRPAIAQVASTDIGTRVGAVRIAFGAVWAIAAWYKWQPAFKHNFVTYFTRTTKGQPAWVDAWARFWRLLIVPHSAAFYAMTVSAETLIAICLVFGFARRPLYLLGGLFSLMVWASAESFGRFWSPGQTDLGTSIMYVFVFAALFALDRAGGSASLAIDGWIERRFAWWRHLAEP